LRPTCLITHCHFWKILKLPEVCWRDHGWYMWNCWLLCGPLIGSTQDRRFSYWSSVCMKATAHVFFIKLMFHSCMLLYFGKLQAYGTCVLCWIPCLSCVLPRLEAGVLCAFLNALCIVKVKWSHYRPSVAQRVGRGIALLFNDRSTRRGEWSAARPGHNLPPGKTRYPLYRRLGGAQGRSSWAEYLVPTGIRSWTVQPVVSRYTKWPIQPKCVCVCVWR